ncbi:MAG: flagellar biosynthesis protein FlhB [Lachnospiraceae bacterium]|nr:flagellar biosynthesis protein FlhB [Lachnospiraceae bacterium]
MSLRYNLQFFADDGQGGEKTEPATQKKLDDARKKGQVAKSKEVAVAFTMLALFITLKVWIGIMGPLMMGLFKDFYGYIPGMISGIGGDMNHSDMRVVFVRLILFSLLLMAPMLLVGFVVSFISDIIQVGWKVANEAMKPKFNKLNPISGFKRIFSINSVVELIKSLAKIFLISYVIYSYLKTRTVILLHVYDLTLMQTLNILKDTVINLGIRISLVYMIIALADFIYQKLKFKKDMRMTKQEVKEEYKQQEGDPQVKGKIKQKMQQASMRRMMAELPKADVVITNPTHYAVAIRYDGEVDDAPRVIAKGEDYLAARIKEKAKEYDIEIVENKPLARQLYANVEIGETVPTELYQAVAEVLAFVYHLKGKV